MREDHLIQDIPTVSELTSNIKLCIEGNFPYVWVRGQVANVSRASSGHVYFSLWDNNSKLNAVWFKGQHDSSNRFDPLTGEVYEDGPKDSLALTLEDGQEVICAGKLNVYEPRGYYQINIDILEDVGIGRLQRDFSALQKKLDEEGYFKEERKRPLPKDPKKIAVITSPKGAVIHDFWNTAFNRGTGVLLRLYPVMVQGDLAPRQIVDAFERIKQENWADVIVLIRGGGSLEDLWAFNTEIVAKAVFESSVPVVAGIGHETDYTLADLTADVRASTPTQAATIIWKEKTHFDYILENAYKELVKCGERILSTTFEKLDNLNQKLALLSPDANISQKINNCRSIESSLDYFMKACFDRNFYKWSELKTKMDSVPDVINVFSSKLNFLETELKSSTYNQYFFSEKLFERINLELKGLDPELPLLRGYSIVSNKSGDFIRSPEEVMEGEVLRVKVKDGIFFATVNKQKE